uniref:Uncharacterized protein n=1 Tax=Neogobius melanostomus TaxID=47308 RepID=A0A8C6TPE3_9GOBI
MAQKAFDQETLTCAICLDVLKDPVTIPCGHSYCRRCIDDHWDKEEGKAKVSCPECRESFSPRPVLVKTSRWRKLKAVRSCLQCMASYCKTHLQPHYDAAVFQKHQLVAPSDKLQEYLCSEHSEVKKMFCRTDQQLVCVVCCMDQHKGHDTVSSAAERAKEQATLENRKQQLIKTISDSETDLKRLQQEAQAISRSAQQAVQRSGNSFTQMIRLLEKRRSEVEQQIRSQEKAQLTRVQELQDQVELDISELKKIICEMDTLLNSTDHNHFLQHFSDLTKKRSITAVSRVCPEELCYFDSVTTAMFALKEKLQLSLTQGLTEVSSALSEVDTLLPSRQAFLKYACDITLDPNTVNEHLHLSEGNRRATFYSEPQNYPDHPDRFRFWQQVLSREALTGRCYWEVEMRGKKEFV